MLKGIKTLKTMVLMAALTIAAANCAAIGVNFTGNILSSDGNYVVYISQYLNLQASITEIVVNDAPPEEFNIAQAEEYRWYINDVLLEGLEGAAITLSNDNYYHITIFDNKQLRC